MDIKTIVNLVLVGGATILLAWPLLSKGVATVKDMLAKDEPVEPDDSKDLTPEEKAADCLYQLSHLAIDMAPAECDRLLPLLREAKQIFQGAETPS